MMQLSSAIQSRNFELAFELIANGADVAEVDHRTIIGGGSTPLHDAAVTGNAELITALVKAGADVNAQCDLGSTPLIRACNNGELEAVRRLLDLGADPTICNHEGYSAYGRIPGTCKELIELMSPYRRPNERHP